MNELSSGAPLRVDFSGHNSHEPIEVGKHLTIRYGAKYRRLNKGDTIMLVDMENLKRSYGEIVNITHETTLDILEGLGPDAYVAERSHLDTGPRIKMALMSYYPKLQGFTPLTAIEYEVWLQEL